MGLNVSKNNMYSWVSHTLNFVKGRCPLDCSYCYMKRFPQGPLRLDEMEFKTFHGKNNIIFIGSSCDMFASSVPSEWILRVLAECRKYPENKYLFQSKNPVRFIDFLSEFPVNSILGTTIETNRFYPDISKAPSPEARADAMMKIGLKKMVTLEPIIDFDVDILVSWLVAIKPEWVNIGADSNIKHELPEPSADQVKLLVERLRAEGLVVKRKSNLRRIWGGV